MAEQPQTVVTPEELQSQIDSLRGEFTNSLGEINEGLAERFGAIHPHVMTQGDAPWQEPISSLNQAVTIRLDQIEARLTKLATPPVPVAAPPRMLPPAPEPEPVPSPALAPALNDVGGLPAVATAPLAEASEQAARKINRI